MSNDEKLREAATTIAILIRQAPTDEEAIGFMYGFLKVITNQEVIATLESYAKREQSLIEITQISQELGLYD